MSSMAWPSMAVSRALPLLLCLAMYLVYNINQDMAGAVAATTAVFS